MGHSEDGYGCLIPLSRGTVDVQYHDGDFIWLGDVIQDPYFGIWVDASVGNPNYTNPYDNRGGPGGRWEWYNNLNGYIPERRLAYQYDGNGDQGWSQSYLGVKVLGAEPRTDTWDTFYHQWTWRGSQYNIDWPMPQNEEERYQFMGEHPDYGQIPTSSDFEHSWMIFLSCGPMPNLAPGQRFTASLALIGARWNGSETVDTPARRQNLYLNSDWAQIAYNGEDRNGNGLLDPGEDLDNDNEITRYILPEAPPSPQLIVVPEDNAVTLYWNNHSEGTVDPISNKKDFEGYRIYGSPKTEGWIMSGYCWRNTMLTT